MTVVVAVVSSSGYLKYPGAAIELEQEREVTAELARERGDHAVADYYSHSAKSFWHGQGAERLGLSGRVEAEQLEAVVEGIDPATGELMGRKFGEKSVRGFDSTFAVPKEVSILWADADVATRLEIESAVVEATKAVLDDALGERAMTRMRTSGPGEWLAEDRSPVQVPAEGPAIAVIPEFTSRAGDPHMHIHTVVSSKVYEPITDRFLALDARTLLMEQQAMSGLFAVGLEAELKTRLGVDFGGRVTRFSRGINGIDRGLVEEFSTRQQQTQQGYAERADRFVDAMGHEPTPQQAYRLEVQAQRETRQAKQAEQLRFQEWQQQISNYTGLEPGELARTVIGRDAPANNAEWSTEQRLASAVREVTDRRSAFTRGDLMAEIARVQPVGAKAETAAEAVERINAETAQALEEFGREITVAGTDEPVRKYTTDEVLDQEIRVFAHLEQATADPVPENHAVRDHAPKWLDDLQLQAAARSASTSQFEILEGLAGAGKTSTLTAAVDTLAAEDRAAFGLAPSSVAADVLATETGMAADNISKFLWEHNERQGGPAAKFDLPAGATLFIDEAGMVSTPHWVELTALAQAHDWRIVAVGDPYQFSAVGRGGVFAHALDTLPQHRISRLEQVHRFNNDWEGKASAGIRQGNHEALDAYFEHDRVRAIDPTRLGPTGDAIEMATWRRRSLAEDGTEVAVFATTNETVDRLNQLIQKDRIKSGQLTNELPHNRGFYIGDEIETRRNNRELVTDQGSYVKNRDRWTITGHTDQGVTLEGNNGTVTVPNDYINTHTNLAYAQTAHASQGRTINGVAITVIDPDGPPVDRAGLYVPLTRGKQSNEVFVAAETLADARQILEEALDRRWIDAPAISHFTPEQLSDQINQARQIIDPGPKTAAVPPDPHYQQDPLDEQTPDIDEPSIDQVEPPTLELVVLSLDDASSLTDYGIVIAGPEAQPAAVEVEIDPRVLDPDRVLQLVDRAAYAETMVAHAHNELPGAMVRLERVANDLAESNSERNAVGSQLREHELARPKGLGAKKWETDRSQLQARLETVTAQTAALNQQHNTQRNRVSHYKQWQTHGPGDLAHARAALETDRQHLGQRLHNHPDIASKLGPAPAGGAALQAWQSTAGAIAQQGILGGKPPLQVGGIDPSTGLKVVGTLQVGIVAPTQIPFDAPPPPGAIDPKTGFPTTANLTTTSAHQAFMQRDIKTGTAALAQQLPTVPQPKPPMPGPSL